MLNEFGHVKLVDFGLAAPLKEEVEPMSPTGSLIYMAPELLRDQMGGRHIDWWAVGVLAHELLTGRTPWSSLTDKAIIKREVTTMTVAPPIKVSRAGGQFICSLLRQDFRVRLGTTADAEVRTAAFFEGIDWDATERQEAAPAFVPPGPDETTQQEQRAALDHYLSRNRAVKETWSMGLDRIEVHPGAHELAVTPQLVPDVLMNAGDREESYDDGNFF